MTDINALRAMYSYDPETGILRAASSRGRRKAGAVAGRAHSKGYLVISVSRKTVFCHRAAWALHFGEWPSGQIDHINGEKTDNRICNLRVVDNATNHQNRSGAYAGSKSGLLGAHWDEKNKKYRASIHLGKRRWSLGRFDTADEAHAAYMAAKLRIHGGYVHESEGQK